MSTKDKPIDLAQSVAGEEDPGASIDLASPPASAEQASKPRPGMRPGDEAPQGAPGTGESVCPSCGGSGMLAGRTCPECEGTGRITVGIGGG
ncbi:MAG TPA: hypothetical protein VHA82_03220 [Ramlibacter sp.]|uniref:hypothetical protein n=1 Tax=Ramlibacter sp. TaxID=1917967 RepID=UPI002B9DB148|nr:hypothetical protein [Ramlibacter sp.]HVZ42797.1 hypothetical protein [Ramlibacter sp.]